MVEGGREMNDSEKYWRRFLTSMGIMFVGVGVASLPYLFPKYEYFSYFRHPLANLVLVVGLIIFFMGMGMMFYYSKKYSKVVSKKEVEKVDEFLREWENGSRDY